MALKFSAVNQFWKLYSQLNLDVFPEPTGAVKPKVPKKSIDVSEVMKGTAFVGLCPGQGFPVPRYR